MSSFADRKAAAYLEMRHPGAHNAVKRVVDQMAVHEVGKRHSCHIEYQQAKVPPYGIRALLSCYAPYLTPSRQSFPVTSKDIEVLPLEKGGSMDQGDLFPTIEAARAVAEPSLEDLEEQLREAEKELGLGEDEAPGGRG